MIETIIFTDIDGTIIDLKNFSYDKAKQALKLIKEKKVPLILLLSVFL